MAEDKAVQVISLGVDPGNHRTKIVGPRGEDSFLSDIGEYRDIANREKHGDDDMIFELTRPDGTIQRGFAGSLARHESEFGGSIMGGTKAHDDAKIRVLLALHRYTKTPAVFQIVVNQPIKFHSDSEKKKIKDMLLGEHELTVNGQARTIRIDKCEVAAEGAAAFWTVNRAGRVRIIDIGGGTVNLATLLDRKFIDRDSDTLDFGAESTKTRDLSALSRAIVARTSAKWGQDDEVFICGGTADQAAGYIAQYYPKIEVIRPRIPAGEEETKGLESVFANAAGNYELAKRLWQ